jgi:hypothetical protein
MPYVSFPPSDPTYAASIYVSLPASPSIPCKRLAPLLPLLQLPRIQLLWPPVLLPLSLLWGQLPRLLQLQRQLSQQSLKVI